MPRVELRSVYDGFTITLPDDGHAPGNAGKPLCFRANIERTLREKSPIDGENAFFLVEKAQGFKDAAGRPMEPIDGRVWNAECDARLAAHLSERQAQRSDRAASGAPSTGLRHQIMEATKEADAVAADAGAAVTARKSGAKKEAAPDGV